MRSCRKDIKKNIRRLDKGGHAVFTGMYPDDAGIHLPVRPGKRSVFQHLPVEPSCICSVILVFLCVLICSCSVQAAPRIDEAALAPISGMVEQAVDDGRIPGAVVMIGTKEEVLYRKAFGRRSLRPDRKPMTEETVFDIASLTKVIATTTAVMQLVEKGKLHLDAPAAKYWPAFGQYGKGAITLRQLLTHYSGLRVEPALKSAMRDAPSVLEAVAAERPVHPPGRVYAYSDLNFIILGEMVRLAGGLPLDRYCALRIFGPLGMKDTTFTPPEEKKDSIAPTEEVEGRILCGEVHDPISRRMGGVAGHAGVFSTAGDLAAFARMMLSAGRAGDKIILTPASVDMMTMPQSPRGRSKLRGLGWDLQAPFAENMQELPTVGAYSHLGYTGTGIWIDPVRDVYLIVLTNRVHMERGDVRKLREDIKRQLAMAIGPLTVEEIQQRRPSLAPFIRTGKAAPIRPETPVETGIDVLEKEAYGPLQDLRIGLITNHTGRNAASIRTADLLHRAPGVHLLALFSPEHGMEGTADAPVPSSLDRATGLPVYSLYGADRRPAGASLEGLDALVFDIQDAGVRFYTYIATMLYAMEAAAEKGIPFFVLDRPNPITADTVQGPVSDGIKRSFTSCFPLPVRHGMTVGELAWMFNTEDKIGADLRVIRMNGYRRDLWFDETGLAWINPSPNLPSLKAVTLYPGVSLVEGANVSVGRGTQTPFEVVGAPWIRSDQLSRYLNRRNLPGVRFFATRFTPSSGIFRGKVCRGVRIELKDRDQLDPVGLGVEIAAALYRLHPKSFRLQDTLGMVGSPDVLAAIRAKKDPRDIAASWQETLERFRTLRSGYLLY